MLKFIFLGGIGIVFWGGLFAVALKVLSYFMGIEQIGDILAFKLLSMLLITSFALLMFSGILTSLSKLYISRDLLLVHSTPVRPYHIFTARWIDSTVDSSWMVIVYTLPVFIAYGIIYQSGLFFYVSMFMTVLFLALIASALSCLLVVLAVVIIPANRMKNIFVFMGILLFIIIYIAIRLLKPELLVDPEVFESVLVYISSLKTPASPFLPTTWAFDSLETALTGQTKTSLFHFALSASFFGTAMFLLLMIADAFYYKGFSKSQAAAVRIMNRRRNDRRFNYFPGPVRAFFVKEIKTFFRDQTQWSQLFLIAALVVIYIYNFKVLPLEKSPIKTVYLQNLFSFLNMGLALFVLTAVTGRFAFPAVSAETDAIWIVKTSPISLRKFLWIKYTVYYLPLLILSETLIIVTNLLLQVTPFMMALSVVTVFLLVPGIVSMGIGFGAAYPDFKAENPSQTITSYGGLVFMIICAAYIGTVILIEAGPVYRIFMAGIRGTAITTFEWLWATGCFALILLISLLAVIIPMRFGEKQLSKSLS
jgi:ABC-2 type transport system permease protein